MKVLLELGEINWKLRTELVSELSDNESTGSEKILMAIDKLETFEKCKIFGRLCRLKALNMINLLEFSRLTKVIQDSFIPDLELIIDLNKEKIKKIWEGEYYPLISLGLLYRQEFDQEPIRMEQGNDYREIIVGGEIISNYALTDLGKLLKDFYFDLFPIKK